MEKKLAMMEVERFQFTTDRESDPPYSYKAVRSAAHGVPIQNPRRSVRNECTTRRNVRDVEDV